MIRTNVLMKEARMSGRVQQPPKPRECTDSPSLRPASIRSTTSPLQRRVEANKEAMMRTRESTDSPLLRPEQWRPEAHKEVKMRINMQKTAKVGESVDASNVNDTGGRVKVPLVPVTIGKLGETSETRRETESLPIVSKMRAKGQNVAKTREG